MGEGGWLQKPDRQTYIWSWVSNRSGKVHAFDSVANERLELEYRCAVANQRYGHIRAVMDSLSRSRWNTTDELGVFFTHGIYGKEGTLFLWY